jgi:hypothetical protein
MSHGSLFCDVVASLRFPRCISRLGEKDGWGSWFTVNVILGMAVGVDVMVGVRMAVALGVMVDVAVGSGSLTPMSQSVSLLG